MSSRTPNDRYQPKTYNTGVGKKYNVNKSGGMGHKSPGEKGPAYKPNKDPKGSGGY